MLGKISKAFGPCLSLSQGASSQAETVRKNHKSADELAICAPEGAYDWSPAPNPPRPADKTAFAAVCERAFPRDALRESLARSFLCMGLKQTEDELRQRIDAAMRLKLDGPNLEAHHRHMTLDMVQALADLRQTRPGSFLLGDLSLKLYEAIGSITTFNSAQAPKVSKRHISKVDELMRVSMSETGWDKTTTRAKTAKILATKLSDSEVHEALRFYKHSTLGQALVEAKIKIDLDMKGPSIGFAHMVIAPVFNDLNAAVDELDGLMKRSHQEATVRRTFKRNKMYETITDLENAQRHAGEEHPAVAKLSRLRDRIG